MFFPRSLVLCLLLVTAAYGQIPAIAPGGVLNAADYSREIAPGSFFSIFSAPGTTFPTVQLVASSTPLPAELGGLSVEVIDGGRTLPAPIWFVTPGISGVSPGQINAQMPFGLLSASVQIRVRSAAGASNSETASILPRAPRFFTKDTTGRGEAILLHLDYTLVSQQSPAYPGETVVAYMNGLGAVTPALEAGRPGSAAAPFNTSEPIQVSVAGLPAQTSLFAGMAPGFLVYQVNFRVPNEAEVGLQTLVATAGQSQSAAGVRIWVGRNFRFVEASAPYYVCRATEQYKDPPLTFAVTCPSTSVSNAKDTALFKGAVPLIWNDAGTGFAANGRIAGVASSDYCDVVISGQLDATGQTIASARFFEKCHTEDPLTSFVRETVQDYSLANVPVSSTAQRYTMLYGVSGSEARRAVTNFAFTAVVRRADGSPYMSWELFQVPSPSAVDASQIGFTR